MGFVRYALDKSYIILILILCTTCALFTHENNMLIAVYVGVQERTFPGWWQLLALKKFTTAPISSASLSSCKVHLYRPGPSPGFSSRGGQKTKRGAQNQKGGHIFKIQYWMYVATGGPNVKGRRQFQIGEAGTTGPPLATSLVPPEICQSFGNFTWKESKEQKKNKKKLLFFPATIFQINVSASPFSYCKCHPSLTWETLH